MNSTKSKAVYLYGFFDYVAAAVSWTCLYIFRKKIIEQVPFQIHDLFLDNKYILGVFLVSLFWANVYYITGTYTNIYRKSRLKENIKTLFTITAGCTIIFFGLILDDIVKDYRSYYISISFLFSMQLGFTLLFRNIILHFTKKQLKNGAVYFNTLIVGSNHKAVLLYEELTEKTKSIGNKFLGFVEVNNKSANGLKVYLPQLGSVDNIKQVIDEYEIEEVMIAIETSEHDQINHIINTLANREVVLKIIPDMYDILSGYAKMNNVLGTALIEIYPDLMPRWEKNIKRILDIILALLFILVLLPVYIYTAVRVLFSSKGSIFYTQERIGLFGKPFQIIKFRSMYIDAEINGPALSSKHDVRITHWGRVMRKWRLDEIPQFFNVLKGDMSLVGPRPERQFYVDQITERAPHYRHIQRVKPGITSLGMVKYGYAENVEQMVDRLKFDIIYIENISILMDIKIMIYTMLTLMQGRGK
jgi:exopolysaccharide biosynthesis polyprenyl glycosylphosphotransferase